MRHLPSRLRRLDDALADLPLDDPMLLSELDGFLTAIVLAPVPIPPLEWMTIVWGSEADGIAPFDDPRDVRWFADAVRARHDEIARDLGRGKPRPILDVDERNGEVLWEVWVDGFDQAMALRPDDWAALAAGDDPDAAAALARIALLIAIDRGESDLDSVQIDAMHDQIPADLIDALVRLNAARQRQGGVAAAPSPAAPASPGRNAPCPCGSGRKTKRCCA